MRKRSAEERERSFWGLTVAAVLLSSFIVSLGPSAEADRKKDTWLASCPTVQDVNPSAPTPKTRSLIFQNTGQVFERLTDNGTELVTEDSSAIGCYVVEDLVSNPQTSPQWQIGTLNRGDTGFYFRNAAGIAWNLKLSANGEVFELQPGSLYYGEPGLGFRVSRTPERALDCKVRDWGMGPLRNGHPRNPARVKSVGETRNLILTVDFPDAPLTVALSSVVDEIIGPNTVTEFFNESSNGKFRPKFEVFPHVVRMRSNQSSFAPNGPGQFFVNGVQQDHRLVSEALQIARALQPFEEYESITIFAPTAKSLLYYGSAFVELRIETGNQTLFNSQMIGGDVGNNQSAVPSWKVVAHEYGHLLGMFDYYISQDGNTGKSPGPFDLMGNTSGQANTFLGFQRWVQGWLEDSRVHCDLSPSESKRFEISPINSNSGKSIYVHPINGSVALVVEYRKDSRFDKLQGQDGLLVYTIDMAIGSGKGPISIHHSEQDRPSIATSDVQRYLAAPLSVGQYVRVGGVAIVAESIGAGSATLISMPTEKLQTYLQAKESADASAAPKPRSIVCIKGLQVRKVTGLNPKCLKGFKQQVTIACVKGSVKRTVTGLNPRCPAGFNRQ